MNCFVCLCFVTFQDVFKTKGFQELSESALCVLLQSNQLTLDEIEILASVKEWAAINSVSQNDGSWVSME